MSTKVFEHFPLFPRELRMMVIDEMESEDRCRFTRCSRLCSNEAKNSNKYLEELQLEVYDEMYGGVTVVYSRNRDSTQHGYSLEIIEISKMKYIKYSSLSTENEIWRMEVNISTDAIKHIIKICTQLLHLHQNRIKKICLIVDSASENPHSETILKNYDFGIKQLNSLEGLDVYGIDIIQFISKIRKPLKLLKCSKETSDTIMPYFDQISQVQYDLCIPSVKLNYDQFLQLSAGWIYVHIGKMTENDIYNCITSWRNGTSRRNIEKYRWGLKESHFDVGKLFRLLGEEFDNTDYKKIEIKHNKKAGKWAELCYRKFKEVDRWISFQIGWDQL